MSSGNVVPRRLDWVDGLKGVSAICLVSLVCMVRPAQSFLGKKPLAWLGKISMNIYLLHMTVLYMITCRMADVMSLSLGNVIVMFAVTLVATVVLSYVYGEYVEGRLNRVVDKMLAKC